MKVIFVCKHNRFRSKVAEAYFRKNNKNKNVKFISGGIFRGEPVARVIKKIGKKLGINITGEPRGLNERDLVTADMIIITANDVPVSLFKPRFHNVVHWNIQDCSQHDNECIERTMKKIFIEVDELVRYFKNRKG